LVSTLTGLCSKYDEQSEGDNCHYLHAVFPAQILARWPQPM